jgi:hypothetical protein
MSITKFQLRVLESIELRGKVPGDCKSSAARRASINTMVIEKWIVREWHREPSGAWWASYALTPVGVEILHQPKLAI